MTLKDLVAEAEYARLRGVTVRSIQRERAMRTGPDFIKIGRRIFYRPEAIDAWLLALEQAQPRSAHRAA